ncbi:unnamed protein product, partial [Urochloa humidicola]
CFPIPTPSRPGSCFAAAAGGAPSPTTRRHAAPHSRVWRPAAMDESGSDDVLDLVLERVDSYVSLIRAAAVCRRW